MYIMSGGNLSGVYHFYTMAVTAATIVCICYSMGRSDIRGNISRVVGIVAVKSHEAKPSAISPLYRKRVEYIPEFHDCPCYNILIPRLHNGGAI